MILHSFFREIKEHIFNITRATLLRLVMVLLALEKNLVLNERPNFYSKIRFNFLVLNQNKNI